MHYSIATQRVIKMLIDYGWTKSHERDGQIAFENCKLESHEINLFPGDTWNHTVIAKCGFSVLATGKNETFDRYMKIICVPLKHKPSVAWLLKINSEPRDLSQAMPFKQAPATSRSNRVSNVKNGIAVPSALARSLRKS